MTKIDELKIKPATSVSCCILFVSLHGDASAQVLAEQAAAEYLQSFQQSVQRTVEACRANHDAFQRMRLCPEFCPECGERLRSR